MLHASALIGIFRDLHGLFRDDLVDRWVRRRNAGPLFAQRTPLEVMFRGMPGMIEIRRQVGVLQSGLRAGAILAWGLPYGPSPCFR